ncbi:LCP family protein [Streptomyces sp. NPDC001941]|uniref:LCP family protein n=1 Tax=Streptomyces sp. NPDC001941 TaxID=3154659 RepID=UPI00333472F8
MGQNSVRGEGTRQRAPQARDLGRDDGPHDGGERSPQGAAGSAPGGSGPGRGHRRGGPRRRGAGGKGRKGGRRRILRWTAAGVSLLVLGTAGAGYLYYEHLNGNIRKGERSASASGAQKAAPNAAGQTPLNVLLIGSDSRASEANQKLGGSRDNKDNPPLADVQMLLHVSADRKNASVVSIPRDTRVDIPECQDPKTKKKWPAANDLINETLGRGGPGCTLSTWEKLTGIYIDHWMTIDFAGVVAMSDAIGGAEVCVKYPVWDHPTVRVKGGSGLKLAKAGKQTISGEQALQWLRTRHAFSSDIGRSQAQHMYMNSVIRNLKQQDAFTDGGRLMDLAETATKSLQVSEEIGTVKKLFDLGMTLKDVPLDRITMLTMPRVQDPRDENRVLPAPGKADQLWQMLRDDVAVDGKGGTPKPKASAKPKDPASAPGETGVLVRNGTYTAQLGSARGRATTVAGLLVGKGYARAKADQSSTAPLASTTVYFPSADLEGDAQAVAGALGVPLTSVKKSTDVSGVTLVVGADWRTGSAYPKASTARPKVDKAETEAQTASDEGGCMDVYAPYRWSGKG